MAEEEVAGQHRQDLRAWCLLEETPDVQCNPPIFPGYFAFYALCPDPTRVECEVLVPELSWRCKMPREFIEDPLAPATQDTRRRALQ